MEEIPVVGPAVPGDLMKQEDLVTNTKPINEGRSAKRRRGKFIDFRIEEWRWTRKSFWISVFSFEIRTTLSRPITFM